MKQIMIDDIDGWFDSLTETLDDIVDEGVLRQLQNQQFEWFEDPLEYVFEHSNKKLIVESTYSWFCAKELCLFHGSRLTSTEVELIRANGLVSLEVETRKKRLHRVLSKHASWEKLKPKLEQKLLDAFSHMEYGERRDQVHLTLSKRGLLNAFNHYLYYGSELDLCIVVNLLGDNAKSLLSADGDPVLISASMSGKEIFDRSPFFHNFDAFERDGEPPGILKHFLNFWANRICDAKFSGEKYEVDCGIMLDSTGLRSDEITKIEIIENLPPPVR